MNPREKPFALFISFFSGCNKHRDISAVESSNGIANGVGFAASEGQVHDKLVKDGVLESLFHSGNNSQVEPYP